MDEVPWTDVACAFLTRWAPLQAGAAVAGFVAVWCIVRLHRCFDAVERSPAGKAQGGGSEGELSASQADAKRQRVLWMMRLTGLGMQMNAMSLVPIAHRIAEDAGAGLTASGLLLGAHYAGGALGLAVFYILSSRTVLGSMLLHTTLMATGSLLCIAGQAWFPSLGLVVFSRVVCGAELGIGLITNVVTVQLSTPQEKARNIMLNDIGCAVGSCFGPLLTTIVPFLPNPLAVTMEAQVTVVIMVYGLILLGAVLMLVPKQSTLDKLYNPAGEDAGAASDKVAAPEPRPLAPAKPGVLIGGCLALGAMDGMVYRCNMSDLVLVVPAEYGLTVQQTAGIMGMSHWFRVASMAFALRLLGSANQNATVWKLTVAELAVGLFFFHLSSEPVLLWIWALWPVLVFQAVGVLGAVKGNVLKCMFTGHADFANKDVIMANSVLSMLGSFAAPVVDRSVAEIRIAQNIMPWYGVISRVMQLGVWILALFAMGTAVPSPPDQETRPLL